MKKFETPEVEVEKFELEDVLTTSTPEGELMNPDNVPSDGWN